MSGAEWLLDCVRTFADHVLREARPAGSPLFRDRLDEDGRQRGFELLSGGRGEFELSNLAGQQFLLRTLVGLTELTGNEAYRRAAADAVRLFLDRFTDEAGLPAWGGHVAVALPAHDVAFETGKGAHHELKSVYPYYELMWEVAPEATRRLVEAFWNAHVLDWSALDFNRHGRYRQGRGRLWDSDYAPGPVFFWGRGLTFVNAGSDLYYAAAVLARLSGREEPLTWGLRLAARYVETRQHPVGISGYQFSQCAHAWCDGPEVRGDRACYQYAPYLPSGHLVYEGTIFRPRPVVQRCQLTLAERSPRACAPFRDWAHQELLAWARVAYRPGDNTFVPMLTDGYSLEGFVIQKHGYFGPKGRVESAFAADADFLKAYTRAFRLTGDDELWPVIRAMARGNGLGDVGSSPGAEPRLAATVPADHRCADALLDLHAVSHNAAYLQGAKEVAENIVHAGFRDGWFTGHRGRAVECPEALSVLRVVEALGQSAPRVPEAP
jgi:pectate lyase